MAEEIFINHTVHETRVAIIENGSLLELFLERNRASSLVGNIYLGKIVRVLPGMQAAFVEIGETRAAFLHVEEVNYRSETPLEAPPPITSLLKEGELVPVQVIKDPIGTKGARLTTYLSLASRYLVWMPSIRHIGVSQRIEDESERNRLVELMSELVEDASQYILRTAAEGTEKAALAHDIAYLIKRKDWLNQQLNRATPASLVYQDLALPLRALRDSVTEKTARVWFDHEDDFSQAQAFATQFLPDFYDRIQYYDGERPLFELYNIEEEIQRALNRKVSLKSGGHLVFDQTEAMTTVDVNTGAFVGKHNLEETIFKTNLEAARVIARQLRLRNLGGIIIIDFIDMLDEGHRQQVLETFERFMKQDSSKFQISPISPLGLIEMTRKRTRESLGQVLCDVCPTCQGRGMVKSADTVCFEIVREVLRNARHYRAKEYLVLASDTVVDQFLEERAPLLADLQSELSCPITFRAEPLYAQEQFDVVLR